MRRLVALTPEMSRANAKTWVKKIRRIESLKVV